MEGVNSSDTSNEFDPERCYLVELPKDLLVHKIFMELLSVNDVIHLQMTCKKFYEVGQDEQIWKMWIEKTHKVFCCIRY